MRRRAGSLVALAFAGSALTAASPASAEPAAPFWDPAVPRFQPAEYAVTAAALAGAAVFEWAIKPNANPSKQAGELDEAVRDAFRFPTAPGRAGARTASDVLIGLNIAYPLLAPPLLAYARGRPISGRDAFAMSMIDAEVLSLTAFTQAGVSALVGRERPFGRTCPAGADPSRPECASSDRYRSFFSGHTSMSFAAAGLSCSHHLNLHILGPVGDPLACATSMIFAATTGVLRIAGDKHYFSDVLVGAAFGSAIGLGVPWLLHYRHGRSGEQGATLPAGLSVAPGPMGASVSGVF
ncbi:MAG: phosphatase PAP2 family protein [Byssovorax sp.]